MGPSEIKRQTAHPYNSCTITKVRQTMDSESEEDQHFGSGGGGGGGGGGDKPRIATGFVMRRNKDGSMQVLVLQLPKTYRRLKNQWSFPGGMVDAGESFLAGFVREYLEETALGDNMTSVQKREWVKNNDHLESVIKEHFEDDQVIQVEVPKAMTWSDATQSMSNPIELSYFFAIVKDPKREIKLDNYEHQAYKWVSIEKFVGLTIESLQFDEWRGLAPYIPPFLINEVIQNQIQKYRNEGGGGGGGEDVTLSYKLQMGDSTAAVEGTVFNDPDTAVALAYLIYIYQNRPLPLEINLKDSGNVIRWAMEHYTPDTWSAATVGENLPFQIKRTKRLSFGSIESQETYVDKNTLLTWVQQHQTRGNGGGDKKRKRGGSTDQLKEELRQINKDIEAAKKKIDKLKVQEENLEMEIATETKMDTDDEGGGGVRMRSGAGGGRKSDSRLQLIF